MNSYRRPVHFRRSKVPRRKNAKRAKINTAVTIVVLFAILCTVGTVILGNHLKRRADEVESHESVSVTETKSDTTWISEGLSSIEPAEGSICSGCLDISGISKAEELEDEIRFIFASGFDSVTIPISENGSLLYYSPAAITLSYMQSDSELPNLDDIVNLIRSVGSEYKLDPTITAYYKLTSVSTEDPVLTEAAFLFDTAIASEAYSLGVDEVLVSGFTLKDSADDEYAGIDYFIQKLGTSSPEIKLGIAFPAETYKSDATAQYLEAIFENVDFLAVDVSDIDWSHSVSEETVYSTDENGRSTSHTEKVHISSVYDSISDIADAIRGSTSLYGLRFIFPGDDAYNLSEAINALSAQNAYDFYVVTPLQSGNDNNKNDDDTDYAEKDDETTAKKDNDKDKDKDKKETTAKVTEKQTEKVTETTKKETTHETETETESETTLNPENWEWILG